MLLDLLHSIDETGFTDLEIIVVDNNSTDGTPDSVQTLFPRVKLIRNTTNQYAAASRNQAMRTAKGKYFLCIDDDNVIDRNMIKELAALMETHPEAGMAGPKMFFFGTKTLLYCGARISHWTSLNRYCGADHEDSGQFNAVCETHHIPNVWITRREAHEAVGGMSEDYRIIFEEADYAVRIAKAGYKILFCPAAITYHRIPPPEPGRKLFKNPERAFLQARNRAVYMRRCASPLQQIFFFLFIFPLISAGYVYLLFRSGDYDVLAAHIKGTYAGLRFAVAGKM